MSDDNNAPCSNNERSQPTAPSLSTVLPLSTRVPPPKLPQQPQCQISTNPTIDPSENESSLRCQNKRHSSHVSNAKVSVSSPTKRVASVQRDNSRLSTHVANELRPSNSKNIDNIILPTNGQFQHHITQTFLGPVCTKCNEKVARNDTLFDTSEYLIKVHLTTNQCYSGNCSFHQIKELTNSLRTSIIKTHHSMKNNPIVGSRIVQENFHPVSSTNKFPYCARCGYVGKQLFNVARHVKSKSNSCTEVDVRTAGPIIQANEYGFLVPSELLNLMTNGRFTLLTDNHTDIDCLVSPSTTHDESSPSTSATHRNYHSSTSMQAPLPRFLPTENEIMSTLCNVDHFNDALSIDSFAQSELLDTFCTKEHASAAKDYLTCFIHLVNQKSPGFLRRTLLDYASIMKSKSTDLNIELLLLSGKKWLQSNSANMDVRMVHVQHRNGMYLIGNSFSDSDKDLLKGSTFTWSENIDGILSQFTSIITFAYSTQWPTITPFISQVNQVYQMTLEMDQTRTNDQVMDLAASKIVNTNIIFGLLTEMLLEQPCIPNGPNFIYKYLAGSTVRLDRNQQIKLRNHNEISKNANALLRLLRHGVCSMYVRKSRDMANKKQSHQEFNKWANEVIQEMQVCQSIGHICRTLRTAREVDRKTPSLVHKAFNDKTGELVVAGSHIHKSIWSVAIPTAIAEWDFYLVSFFPNHSPSSILPLHWIFDLNNTLVLAGSDSYISIGDRPDECIPISEFHPVFPQYVHIFFQH